MKTSFKPGERITAKTLDTCITAFGKSPKFFWLTIKPGLQAMYQLLSAKGNPRTGTAFLLVKLFGEQRMPESVILDGAKDLICGVEIVENLAMYAPSFGKDSEPTSLDVNFLLSLL